MDGSGAEPIQPGWYPSDDIRWQRFYAGRGLGWSDSYMLDIEYRDPLRPPPSRYATAKVRRVVAFVVIWVVLASILVAMVPSTS